MICREQTAIVLGGSLFTPAGEQIYTNDIWWWPGVCLHGGVVFEAPDLAN